jgi:catechol 2,3-dioxygenase-like lactoylglutathione lyase family enzyme
VSAIVGAVFDHVTIRVSDRQASERFYELVLGSLDRDNGYSGEHYAEWGDFSLAAATVEKPVTRRLHVGFTAPTRSHVDEFWRLGIEAGSPDDGEPGPRPQYSDDYYGAFLLDPDGNSAEAVHHGSVHERGGIDHLWIRVADLESSKRFYEAISPFSGFALASQRAERVQFRGLGASFSIVSGAPTENLHLAFPASENATVEAFHAAALDAGYRDSGAPGERSIYHAGYFGAFVLDPDGNNVEVVCHNR